MKIKSVSGLTCYVKDLNKTVEFYENLGFVFKKKEESHATGYSNWFWIDFVLIDDENAEFSKEANAENKGAGLFIYLSVENVDETYEEILKLGLKPSSEPRDWPWGNREFVLRDPDGYKLVFFKRK